MNARSYQALELPRVLAYLAGFTVSDAGYAASLALQPFTSHDEIHRQSAFFEQGRLWVLHTGEKLTAFPSVEAELAYVAAPTAVLELEGLWSLRQLLMQAHILLQDMLLGEENNQWPLWIVRCREVAMPERSISGLSRCLSDDGLLRDEASPELSLVRGELRRLHQQCTRKVKDYAAEYNIMHYLQDAFITLSSDRYVLPLKANFKGRLQGVIHEYSQTGETCYFEPMFLVELNNRLQELKREEREEERKVMVYLSSLIRDELPGIRSASHFLVELDLLFARYALANCYDGRMVEFADGRGVMLREARHPLLALATVPAAQKALRRQLIKSLQDSGQQPETIETLLAEATPQRGAIQVVASTLELLPEQQALVISGGNAGGKTVCLKALGLITLMGLCALPVPVEAGSVLPAWQHIHAFIGDEQSLDDQVSTYTAQITHLARIWPTLSAHSLIILDEFGAGTDPSQGAALAQAVLDSMRDLGAYVVAATHFPALKAYALSTDGVRAASVLFEPQTRKPLFRLVYDQVGASQALDVARRHGLPEAVLQKAEQYLLVSGEDTTVLVERLNALAAEKEKELASLGKEKVAFAAKKQKLQEKFEQERQALFATVQADAQKVLTDWKASRVSHKQALKELSKIRATLQQNAPQEEQAPFAKVDLQALTLRQKVRHIPWKRLGTLLEVDVKKQRVRLDLDGMTLWADAADIALAEGGSEKNIVRSAISKGNSIPSAIIIPLRLDLRGMRADVAINETEKFLDGAILQGREVVEIIHGRGTGALRREIHQFLKGFAAAATYKLAPEDQGGDGVTIVELK